MGETPQQKKSLIGQMLERITILEARVNELENNKTNGAKKYYSMEELSELTGYSVNYLYKKVPKLKKGEHYFKPNGGKLIFDESSVEFLIKGGNQSGESLHENRQPVYLGDFLN
jgi:hypothetical protein